MWVDLHGFLIAFVCVYHPLGSEVIVAVASSEDVAADYQYICVGTLLTAASRTIGCPTSESSSVSASLAPPPLLFLFAFASLFHSPLL